MTQWAFWGTIVNTVAVFFGAMLGLGIRAIVGKRKQAVEQGELAPRRDIAGTIQKGLGLCVVLIGLLGALEVKYVLVMILSIALGALVGELCDLDGLLNRFGAFVERKIGGGQKGTFAQGFVSATLLFCVGAMAIVGSLNSGLLRDHSMLYTKSLIDMISAFVFATTLGFGVMLSAFLVLIYQGTITLLASFLAPLLTEMAINEMTAVGSLLILGLSLNMLQITKIKVMNYVPAVFIALFICLIL